MQIVIDINEEDFAIMKHNIAVNNPLCPLSEKEMVSKVANGIPLPKGHGRLKDVDWIDDNCEYHYSDKDGSWCYACRDVENAPTIIEADRGE